MLDRGTAARRPGVLVALLAVPFTAVLVLGACGGDTVGPGGGGSTETCTSYSLSVTAAAVQMGVGQQTTLTAKVGTCSTKRVLWAVTDSSVLGIVANNDTTATVTGRSKGVAAVLARLQADSIATQNQTVIQVQ